MKKFVVIATILFFINIIIISVYCRAARIIDLRKFSRESSEKFKNSYSTSVEPPLKRLYHFINAYIYGWVRYNILITGNIPSYRIRKLIYKYVFNMNLKKGSVIQGGTEFRSPWNVSIGNSVIGANCIIDARGGITIEDNVVLGSGVHIWTEEHSVNDPYFRVLKENLQPVKIKKYSWICSDTTILPGTIINDGAVLASKALAADNLEAYRIYAGIPAKIIGERNKELKYQLNGKVPWHFM